MLYFLQSFQNWDAENLRRNTMVTPENEEAQIWALTPTESPWCDLL